MPLPEPTTEIMWPNAAEAPTPWIEACRRFGQGGWFWLATVQPDGAPHVMPVRAAWDTSAFFVASDPGSKKSRNLVREGRCVVSKDAGDLHLVVEGIAQRVLDDATLDRAAEAFVGVYGEPAPEEGASAVWEIRPTKAFGFPADAESFAPTRWRFPAGLI